MDGLDTKQKAFRIEKEKLLLSFVGQFTSVNDESRG